ncbi:MAG: IMP dehydrogenase [Ardenticatenales bacterium]|nr:IMP dehydrogenase [Ardenticatenales bacterium]
MDILDRPAAGSAALNGASIAPTLRLRPDAALTFDDVLLVPRYSEVRSRSQATTRTRFSRRIELAIPIVSSNMDTVTESEMAIALARAGGIGVIHRFLTIHRQADEVRRVKRSQATVVKTPFTLKGDATVGDARAMMGEDGVGGLIVIDGERRPIGIVTRRDIMFFDDDGATIDAVMTPRDRLITAPEGTPIADARRLLDAHRIEKLPLLDADGRLAGLITAKDLEHRAMFPDATIDPTGSLRVAAAVGVRPGFLERAEQLLHAGADALVIDIAHGDSVMAVDAARELRRTFGDNWDMVIGNVATAAGTARLIDVGADGIKVGIGPGSICVTRIVTGFGVPQLSAIAECAPVTAAAGVPMVADGGIKAAGDVVKALAAGAQCVMIGSLLAGTRESPGMVVVRGGRRYKVTRGMASLEANIALQATERQLPAAQIPKKEYERVVPEGVEARVPYRGPVDSILYQLVGGLRSGLSYAGAWTIEELQATAEFVRISPAGQRESGPHDVDL